MGDTGFVHLDRLKLCTLWNQDRPELDLWVEFDVGYICRRDGAGRRATAPYTVMMRDALRKALEAGGGPRRNVDRKRKVDVSKGQSAPPKRML